MVCRHRPRPVRSIPYSEARNHRDLPRLSGTCCRGRGGSRCSTGWWQPKSCPASPWPGAPLRRTGRPAPAPFRATTDVDTEELVGLLLTRSAAAAAAFIDLLRLRGATPESLYTRHPVRRRTPAWGAVGGRPLRFRPGHHRRRAPAAGGPRPGARLPDAAVRPPEAHRILLLPVPGEQHSFGLLLLAEFFRRAGWHVVRRPGHRPAAILRIWCAAPGSTFSVFPSAPMRCWGI